MKVINTYYVSSIGVYTKDQFSQSLEIWLMDKFKNCIISSRTDGNPVYLEAVIKRHIEYLMKKHGIKGRVVAKINDTIKNWIILVFDIKRKGDFMYSKVFVNLNKVGRILGDDDIEEIEIDTLKRMESLGK